MNTVAYKPSDAVAESSHDQRFISPEVNILEAKEGYLLKADMPGVNKSGLEITLEGSELTITGRRQSAAPKGNLLHRETRPDNFRRVFELDPSIDASRVTAHIEQGVLTLQLPKAEAVKPRKVEVTE
jgi:HSP20 family protein